MCPISLEITLIGLLSTRFTIYPKSELPGIKFSSKQVCPALRETARKCQDIVAIRKPGELKCGIRFAAVPQARLNRVSGSSDITRSGDLEALWLPGSLYEHCIAITIKSIAMSHGYLICIHNQVSSCKCRYKNQQARTAQMKVSY